MTVQTYHLKFFVITIMTTIAFQAFAINGLDSLTARKLQEEPIKCTPCLQNPPPPSPPPPPSLPCPPPPPPPPKKKFYNCPPPPSTYIYMTGPPGELYPVDQHFGVAARESFTVVKILSLVTFGVMCFLINMN
ncbi:unnamed protein product [Cochlearia groenlandica]